MAARGRAQVGRGALSRGGCQEEEAENGGKLPGEGRKSFILFRMLIPVAFLDILMSYCKHAQAVKHGRCFDSGANR
jgi:hypothetical protein